MMIELSEIGTFVDLDNENHASSAGEWFVLSGKDGRLYRLGHCAGFDEAEERAEKRQIEAMWLVSPYIASVWRLALDGGEAV